MGHDQYQRSNSSGTLVAVIGVGLVLVILAIITIAGVGVFWVRASTQQAQAVAMEERAIAEAQRTMAMSQLEQSRVATTPDPRLIFEVEIDGEGIASVDDEKIDLDELKAKLTKLKDETSNAYSVQINVDLECPVKHFIPVLDVCGEVGDVDYRIKTSEDSVVQVTATVASYEPAAEWDHFEDGTFSAYDVITLKVVTPERHAGATLSITVPPTELPEDSAFRATGTRFTFMTRESYIGATGLAWGAIDDPTIEK
ncbi:MAG: biopolymer transporter ExbD [Planctomycetes bacterium]|nr:biopolymer transporter ExbD [Planctomycetota bacterium]